MDAEISVPRPISTSHNSAGERNTDPIARLKSRAIKRKMKEKRKGLDFILLWGQVALRLTCPYTELFKQPGMQQFRQLFQSIHQTRTRTADEVIIKREDLAALHRLDGFPTGALLYGFGSDTPYRIA